MSNFNAPYRGAPPGRAPRARRAPGLALVLLLLATIALAQASPRTSLQIATFCALAELLLVGLVLVVLTFTSATRPSFFALGAGASAALACARAAVAAVVPTLAVLHVSAVVMALAATVVMLARSR